MISKTIFRLGKKSPSRHFFPSLFSSSSAAFNNIIQLDIGTNGVANLVLNRHDGKNSFSKAMLEDFNQAVASLHVSSKTNVVIISSGVPKVFCAGADLKERATMPESEVV